MIFPAFIINLEYCFGIESTDFLDKPVVRTIAMYNQIPQDKYSYYSRNILGKVLFDLPNNTKRIGYIAFNASLHTLRFYLHDYSAFLAHKDKWINTEYTGNKLETIHLGLNVATNFTNIWDHMGYVIYGVFELNIKPNESYFGTVIGMMCENQEKALKTLCKRLQKLFESEKELRDYYRNQSCHRMHECFVQRNVSDTPEQKLIKLSTRLEKSYNTIISAFIIYRNIMKNYS